MRLKAKRQKNWDKMESKVYPRLYDFVKLVFVIILLYLFISWQAIPCTEAYLKKEVMTIVYQVRLGSPRTDLYESDEWTEMSSLK